MPELVERRRLARLQLKLDLAERQTPVGDLGRPIVKRQLDLGAAEIELLNPAAHLGGEGRRERRGRQGDERLADFGQRQQAEVELLVR